MMQLRVRTFIVLSLVYFATGFLTSVFAVGCKSGSDDVAKSSVSSKQLEKQRVQIDASYQKQIQDLTTQNFALQSKLKAHQDLLQKAKRDATQSELKIKKFLQPSLNFRGKSLFNGLSKSDNYLSSHDSAVIENSEIAIFNNQKAVALDPCDSLRREVVTYIEASHRKDSIYELQLLVFDSLLTVKDLIIETSKKGYDDLQGLLDKSITSQATLEGENISLKRGLRRQGRTSKIFGYGLLILSGFTASKIIKH